MGLDLSKYKDIAEPASSGMHSNATFRNLNMCYEKSDLARENDVPVGNFYLIESNPDENDETPIVTDMGKTIDNVYIIDKFQHVEFIDEDDDDKMVATSLQFKNQWSPLVVHDIVQKGIMQVAPYCASRKTMEENPDFITIKDGVDANGATRKLKNSVYLLIKIGDEWKGVKHKASWSTLVGAVYDKKAARPDPCFSEHLKDSYEGFMEAAGKLINPQFVRLVSCTLGIDEFGGGNKRMTFTTSDVADDAMAEIVMEQYNKLKADITDRNDECLKRIARETVDWEGIANKDVLLYYLKNPEVATFNYNNAIPAALPSGEGITKLLLESKDDGFDEDVEDAKKKEPEPTFVSKDTPIEKKDGPKE